MKVKTWFLIVFFIASSCQEDVITNIEFTVVIEETPDMSCYLPIIRFLDNIAEVKRRTRMETLTYNAYQLADSLNLIGNKLAIEFTLPLDEDIPVCNTYGVPFPGVLILKASLIQ